MDDQHDGTKLYIGAALFLVGAAIAVLTLAAGAAERARDQARAQRRRHAEDLAELDRRIDAVDQRLEEADSRLAAVERPKPAARKGGRREQREQREQKGSGS